MEMFENWWQGGGPSIVSAEKDLGGRGEGLLPPRGDVSEASKNRARAADGAYGSAKIRGVDLFVRVPQTFRRDNLSSGPNKRRHQVVLRNQVHGPAVRGTGSRRSDVTSAYRLWCKTRREMHNPQSITMKNGRHATRGTCPVCGTTLLRIGA